jgi:hypothetical protein
MTIQSGPVPSETRDAQIYWRSLRSPPIIFYIIVLCVKEHLMVCWSLPYRIVTSPLNQRCSNTLKTYEIPTHRPYMLLMLLVSGNMWWYLVMTIWSSSTGWSHGHHPLKRKCPIISKTTKIPTPINHRYKPVGFLDSDLPCMLH